MAGEGQVLMHLVQLGRDDYRQGVFLSIDRALLQRREHLGKGHGRGDDAKTLVTVVC